MRALEVFLGEKPQQQVSKKYRCLSFHQRMTEEIYLLLCGIENCLPGYTFRVKVERPGWHVHVILSGKGVLCTKDGEQELHFGQMFVTKPGEPVWYRADREDPWSYCWMTFDGTMARGFMDSAGFREGVYTRNCNMEPQRFYALCRRVLDQPEMTQANDLMRLGLLLEYISLAVQSNSEAEQGEPHRHEYAPDIYVQYAVDFINENYATAKITDVAGYIGIHRSYLTSIFKKKMGISPQEYLLQCRLKHSNRLLLETDLPIQEVSREVGYDNPLTFSKVFKRFYGVSPRKFRNQSSKSGSAGETEPGGEPEDESN